LPPLLKRLTSDKKLLAYTRQIQLGKRIKFYPSQHPSQERLELLGVIKEDREGFCVIRNRIYEQALASIKEPNAEFTPSEVRPTWDTATIRHLLTAAFNSEELTTFCFDHFRAVYEGFGGGMSKSQRIQRLMDYCDRHNQLEKLLKLVEENNPAQFARFASQG